MKQEKIMASAAKGAQFVGVRGYRNSRDEVASYTISMGISNETMNARELAKLQETSIADLLDALPDHDVNAITDAYRELVASRETPTGESNRSAGQVDAYETLANGLKRHKKSGNVMLTGIVMSKKVTKQGKPKPEPKKAKTKAKRAIEKHLGFYNRVQFNLSNITAVRMAGKLIL